MMLLLPCVVSVTDKHHTVQMQTTYSRRIEPKTKETMPENKIKIYI